MGKMDDKKALVNAKNFAVDASKKGKSKKTDAQDWSTWRLGCKTGKQAGFQENEDIYQHSIMKQIDDDDPH